MTVTEPLASPFYGTFSESAYTYTILSVELEPVTIEGGTPPDNACGIEKGQSSDYKIKVEPAGIPDADIVWSKVSGNISFVGGNSGRTVTIKGDDLGVAKAKVDISGFSGTDPTIEMEVLEKKTVDVYVCIIREDGGGNPATDAARVTSLLADVNKLYEQVAMEFVQKGAILTHDKTDWLIADSAERTAIRNIQTGTGGIELYFVDQLVGGATAANAGGGIVIGDGGDFRTLAHEIGHACDRRDIYPSNGGFAVSGAVSETREPKDWNSGPGPQYYDTSLDQENLIYRLLMYGTYSTTKADIPRGSIYGVWKPLGGVYQKSQAPVGLDGMDRTPTHN